MAEAATIRPRAPQLLATALGINLWLTMLVVPALYLRFGGVKERVARLAQSGVAP